MRVDDLAAKGLGRQSRNQISEYLSQRRKGRKGKNCHFDRREKSFLDPSYPLGMTGTARHLALLASWRDEHPNPMHRELRVLRGESHPVFFTSAGWFARLPSLR
jgi:hypothetical protein